MIKKYLIKDIGTGAFFLTNDMFGPPQYGVRIFDSYDESEKMVHFMVSSHILQITEVFLHESYLGYSL